jgi:AAHS family 4-hydroxybenzoate transporter-like MFS transporter
VSARANSTPIDLQKLIDNEPISRGLVLLVAGCFLAVAIDGFDTALIGFVAPAIRREWALDAPALSPLFASGLFGLMTGAFITGPLADRHGRKVMLIVCLAFFGVASILSAAAANLGQLVMFRFLTGIGLGGAMPNAITLTSEFCPAARRSTLITVMFCGFTIGSAVSGFVAAAIIPGFGWRTMFVIGGSIPLLLTMPLIVTLPESARYLLVRRAPNDVIARAVRRVVSRKDLGTADFTPIEPSAPESPVAQLFEGSRAIGTLLLWTAFFMSLLVVYLLSSWLPTLITDAGSSVRHASLVTAMFQVGGTAGAIAVGRLMDGWSPHYVLGATFASATVFVAGLGHTQRSPWLLAFLVFGAGFCVSGSQVGANALAADFYPTENRATGVGWALAIGRVGSIVGSILGGVMLAQHWTASNLYAAVSVPPLIAGAAILALRSARGS